MLAKYFSFLSLIKVNCNVFSQIFEIIFELSDTEFIDRSSSSSSSLGEVSTSGQRQTGLGPRVYPFLPQAAVLPESDAGSDAVKPASSFVIQNCQTLCSMWCPMYRARY